MSSEHEAAGSEQPDATAETDARTGQPVEEEEKNLSRHSTSDSSPSIAEQERTTVRKTDA